MCAIAGKIVRIAVRMSATVARIAAMRWSTAAAGIGSKTCGIVARIGAIAWKTAATGVRIGGTADVEVKDSRRVVRSTCRLSRSAV
jgi:hypothetical protein